MKKRIFALALGMMLGVGALAATAPTTVLAAECTSTANHVSNVSLTPVAGAIEVTLDQHVTPGEANDVVLIISEIQKTDLSRESTEFANESASIGVYEEHATITISKLIYWDQNFKRVDIPLKSDTPYYVYAKCYDESCSEGYHDYMYLGSCMIGVEDTQTPATPTPAPETPAPATPAPPKQDAYSASLSRTSDRITSADSGATVEIEGIISLDNATMKSLLRKGNVSVKMTYTYEGTEYTILIPAGAAVDDDIPWYGPLYLAGRYGINAGSTPAESSPGVSGSGESVIVESTPAPVYTVQAGDTLNRIAKANGMSVAELKAKNPQIKNFNMIKVGQTINL